MNDEMRRKLAESIDPSGRLNKSVEMAKAAEKIGNTLAIFSGKGPLATLGKTLTVAGFANSLLKRENKQIADNLSPRNLKQSIGDPIAKAQADATLGVAEALNSPLQDLRQTISTDIKGGISGIKSGAEDYFELKDNQFTSKLLSISNTVGGWGLKTAKSTMSGGQQVAANSVDAINDLTDSVTKGNKELKDTINENLRGSPPYLRTLAEANKPAARKRQILSEMDVESEGNIKQIRKKRFRLIREYKELYFKPLAKEIVKAQTGGIFKKIYNASAFAAEVHWKKSVLSELSTIREGLGFQKQSPWAREIEIVKGFLGKRKNVKTTVLPSGEVVNEVQVHDAYINAKDALGRGKTIINTLAKDSIIIGTNLFAGLKEAISGLASTIGSTIRGTLSKITEPIQASFDKMRGKSRESELEKQRSDEETKGILQSIADNTEKKKERTGKGKGILGFLEGIPGISGLIGLVNVIGKMGTLAAGIIGPAMMAVKAGGVFFKLAKLFSWFGLAALAAKPIYDALKAFQSEEGTFGDKLKAAGSQFFETLIGMFPKAITGPIEKFFSEGIGLKIKTSLEPVFNLLRKGFDVILAPINNFFGKGGKGEGIANMLGLGFNMMMSALDSIFYALEPAINILKTNVKFIGDIFMMAWPTIKSIGALFANVAKIVLPLLLGVGVLIVKVMAPIVRTILQAFNLLQKILFPILKGLFFGINTIVQAVVGFTNALLEPFDFTSVDNAIASFLNIPLTLVNLPIKLAGKFVAWLTGLFGFEQFSQGLASAVKDFSIGKLLVQGFKQIGFGEVAETIGEEIKGAIQATLVFMPKHAMRLFLMITEFPLRVIQKVQQTIAKALKLDILQGLVPNVKKFVGPLLRLGDILGNIAGHIPIFGGIFKGGIKGVTGGLRGIGSFVENSVKLATSDAINPFKTFSADNVAKRIGQLGQWLTSGTKGITDMAKAISGKGFGILDRLGKFATGFVNFIKDPAKPFGKIVSFIDELTAGLGQAATIFPGLDKVKGLITTITGPIISLFRGVGDVLGGMGKIAGPIAKLLGPLKQALKLNPIGFIFTAIDSVIQGFQGFMKGFEEGGILGGIEGGVKGIFMALIGDMIDMFVKIPTKLVGWLIGLLPGGDELKAAIYEFADNFSIKKILAPLFSITDHIDAFIVGFNEDGIVGGAKRLLGSLMNAPVRALEGIVNNVTKLFGLGEVDLQAMVKPAIDKIVGILGIVLQFPIDTFKKVGTKFNAFFDHVWENIIPPWMKNIIGKVTDPILRMLNWVGDALQGAFDNIKKLDPRNWKLFGGGEEKELKGAIKESTKNLKDHSTATEKDTKTTKEGTKFKDPSKPTTDFKKQMEEVGATTSPVGAATIASMIETDPQILEGIQTRKEQLNQVVTQLHHIYDCLTKIEVPIQNLDTAAVAENIKTIADTSTTAKEATLKVEPILADVKEKVAESVKVDEGLLVHQLAIEQRNQAIEKGRKLQAESIAKQQRESEERTRQAYINAEAAREHGRRLQAEAELLTAIQNIAPTKEEKAEEKKRMQEWMTAPSMSTTITPDFTPSYKSTQPISSELGNIRESIVNSKYLKEGLKAVEGTQFGNWLGEQKEGFGHTWGAKGMNLHESFQKGGEEGLYRATRDMVAPGTVVGKWFKKAEDRDTSLGKAANAFLGYRKDGKKGMLSNMVGMATKVEDGEKKKWWQSAIQFSHKTGLLDKATSKDGIVGGVGKAKKLWETGLNFFNRGEKQIEDSEKSGITAKSIGSKLKGFILGKGAGKADTPPAEGIADKIINKDGGVLSSLDGKVTDKVAGITSKFEGMKGYFEKISKFFSDGMVKLLSSIGKMMKAVGSGIAAFFKGLGQGIAGFVKALASAAPAVGAAAPVLALLIGAIIGIGAALRLAAPAFEAFANIIKAIGSAIAGVITAIAGGVKTVLGGVSDFLDSLGQFSIAQMTKIVIFIAALAPAFAALGLGLGAFGLAAFVARGAMDRLGTILVAVAEISKKGNISSTFSQIGKGMLQMSKDIKRAAKDLKSGDTKRAIKTINDIMDSFDTNKKRGGIFGFGGKKRSLPKTIKLPDIEMGSITAASLHLQTAIVAPIAPEQEKMLMDQETLGRVHISDASMSKFKNYYIAYMWDPLKRIATATESMALHQSKPEVALSVETERMKNETAKMELRTMQAGGIGGATAINAPTNNINNSATYQSVKPTVRDDRRMRTAAITV